ncbi:hypothetical protein Tco_0150719 [Tanacetum coccineum]
METDVTIWLESQSIRHSLRPWVVTSQREVFSNLHFQLSKVTFLASTHLRNPYISKKIPSQCRCQVHTLDSSNLSSLTSTPTILGLDTSPQQMFASADSIKSFLLAVQVTFLLIMFLLVMFSFLLTEIESADYVSAGHVLVPADRDRIC